MRCCVTVVRASSALLFQENQWEDPTCKILRNFSGTTLLIPESGRGTLQARSWAPILPEMTEPLSPLSAFTQTAPGGQTYRKESHREKGALSPIASTLQLVFYHITPYISSDIQTRIFFLRYIFQKKAFFPFLVINNLLFHAKRCAQKRKSTVALANRAFIIIFWAHRTAPGSARPTALHPGKIRSTPRP